MYTDYDLKSQMEHGFVDAVVPRKDLRDTLIRLLKLHGKGERHG